jgi:protein TonB
MKKMMMSLLLVVLMAGVGFAQEEVFTVVEQMPEYPGGVNARIEFLSKTIIYPVQARDSMIQGTVFVTFIVETDGSISNISILKGVHYLIDAEVIRVIKLMPKWSPGYQRGKAVRVKVNMPVKFKIDDGSNKKQ